MKIFRSLATLCLVCALVVAAPRPADASDGSRFINLSVDAGASSSTSPGSGWGSAAGLSLGMVYRLSNNAGIRLSAERYQFTASTSTDTYSRMPVFLGGRFYFWNMGDIWCHADLGMEMIIDQMKTTSGAGNYNENNMGGAALFGMLYEVSDHLFMGADVKFHMNKNNFFSYGIYLGMVF